MIKAKDAIRIARSLIGTPYAELDCINLIKKVIRTAPGGLKTYTTAGTNALWDSFKSAAKYRDLTWRQEGIAGAQAGMIAFKADGEDYHHAGIVTDVGTVIHSSSTQGGRGVVETPLNAKEGWTHLAVHRYISTVLISAEKEEIMENYNAKIKLNDVDSSVNVRNGPSTDNRKIGTLHHGAPVNVQAEAGDWLYITYGDNGVGYVHKDYVETVNAEEKPAEDIVVPTIPEETDDASGITIVDEEGNTFAPVGSFRVLIGGVD
ncbi:MAG: SH3 domain-containing protein [Clostridia bacterium]|nr:SH3 domain-containing protein [Clostridia bacterium]